MMAQGSGIFPDTLRQALREEVTFERPHTPEPAAETATSAGRHGQPYRTPLLLGASVIISAGLAFLLYRVYRDLRAKIPSSGAKARQQAPADIGQYPEQVLVATGISPELLARAEADGQYTVAVRLAYLGLLHDLVEGGRLQYQPDFSNADYLHQLKPGELRDAFDAVTRHYERFWYGNYRIDRLSYRIVRQSIAALRQQMIAYAE